MQISVYLCISYLIKNTLLIIKGGMYTMIPITGIGSLPYTSVECAIGFSLRHSIPFLPELPGLGDSMVGDDDGILRSPVCLSKFKENSFPRVKMQSVGPVTLFRTDRYDSFDDAIFATYEHVKSLLDGLCADEVILFLDEPGLDMLPFELDYELAWSSVFDEFDVTSGIHTCGNTDWERLVKSGVKIISLDATKINLPVLFPEYRKYEVLASWGIQQISDIGEFQKGDLLTHPCGMSPEWYTVSDCEMVLKNLKSIAHALSNSAA